MDIKINRWKSNHLKFADDIDLNTKVKLEYQKIT